MTTNWKTHYKQKCLASLDQTYKESMPEKDTELFFLTKTLITPKEKDNCGHAQDDGYDGVRYISNINCDNEQSYGPAWKKASHFSDNHFLMGFCMDIKM